MAFLPFPSGTIIAFAGLSIPSGWLLCDGTSYLQNDYSSLWAALSLTQNITLNGTSTITTASTSNLVVGFTVYSTGIPVGTTISSIVNSTTFIISAAATNSGVVTATFTPYDRQQNPTTNTIYSTPPTGEFRVPDYRASFLRGAGVPHSSLGGDATTLGGWQTNKTAKNGLSNSSSTASVSGSKNQFNHSHFVAYGNFGGDDFNLSDGTNSERLQMADQPTDDIGVYADTVDFTSQTFSASGTAAAQTITGDNETRPHNKGVNYIIKI